MPKNRIKIERLIRLATDPGASESEARTSALLAARIIVKDGLTVCEPETPKKKKGKRFKARRERLYTLGGLERRMDKVEDFVNEVNRKKD